MRKFPFYKQIDSKDCGTTCLKIICKYYNKILSISYLRSNSETSRFGSSLTGISIASESLGFRSLGVKISLERLQEAPLPCILHWNKNHFVVLYNINKDEYYVSDPAYGLITYSTLEFLTKWIGKNADEGTKEGVALLIEPSSRFYENKIGDRKQTRLGFSFLSRYAFKFKPYLAQLILGLIAGSLLQLIFPFLTQSIVDVGIKNQNVHFIYLVLFAQLALFLGKTSVEVIRGWILLHLSTRINISLISDFFIKLMRLPIAFFDTRLTGDILQRINDHQRIERILTTSSLDVLFSFLMLLSLV